jgi:hypothetical protein
MPIGGTPQVEEINARGVEPVKIPDPGDAGAIDVSHSGYCELTTAGAETRTIADPVYRGQVIDLVFVSDGGDCVVTAASPLNQTGNTIITFTDIGEHTRMVGFYNATDGWEWRQICNDGAALS